MGNQHPTVPATRAPQHKQYFPVENCAGGSCLTMKSVQVIVLLLGMLIVDQIDAEGSCNVEPQQREECGYAGISSDECEGKGCCFNDKTPGVKWCFKPVTSQCDVSPSNRQECGYGGISASECEGNGCCYSEANINANWCFKPAPEPTPAPTPAPTAAPTDYTIPPECLLDADEGNCDNIQIFYYYNRKQGKCKKLKYTGCGGNDNRFNSKKACVNRCKRRPSK